MSPLITRPEYLLLIGQGREELGAGGASQGEEDAAQGCLCQQETQGPVRNEVTLGLFLSS